MNVECCPHCGEENEVVELYVVAVCKCGKELVICSTCTTKDIESGCRGCIHGIKHNLYGKGFVLAKFKKHFSEFSYNTIISDELPRKTEELWWQKKNLMYTRTGYGRKIPTSEKILFNKRWYRIYSAIFGNSGVNYIITKEFGEINL